MSAPETVLPQIINIELTNRCNLNCVFCDHGRLKGRMKLGQFDSALLTKILDACSVHNIYELGLVGLGEPLLDTQLSEHLGIIRRYDNNFARISLNTNGVAMSRQRSERILDSSVNLVTFSLNASNPAAYRKLMGKDLFHQVVRNIQRFVRLRAMRGRKDLGVSVQYMASTFNDKMELEAYLGDLKNSDVEIYNRHIYNKPILERQKQVPVNLNKPGEERRYPCWSMYSRIYIDIEGNIYPCTIGNDCHRGTSHLNIGNVQHENLIDIFNNPEMRRARSDAEIGRTSFPECEACTVWSLLPNNFRWEKNGWMPVGTRQLRLKDLDRE